MYKKYDSAFTHAGVFHADDVFSTALLQIFNPDITITRGYQVPENFEGIVYDIGLGKYDHHQQDRSVRSNGVPYAAFGLLWKEFGASLIGQQEAEHFDEEFVQPLDLADNTGTGYILSKLISDRNTSWKETNVDNEKRFFEAVAFAKEILEYRFAQIRAEQEAYDRVSDLVKSVSDGILYIDQPMPWKKAVQNTDCLYVIYPSARGGYNIQAVPKDDNKHELKRPFPEHWRGKTEKELQEITGIAGMTFCHMAGFLSCTKTLEEAYAAARLSLKTEV